MCLCKCKDCIKDDIKESGRYCYITTKKKTNLWQFIDHNSSKEAQEYSEKKKWKDTTKLLSHATTKLMRKLDEKTLLNIGFGWPGKKRMGMDVSMNKSVLS